MHSETSSMLLWPHEMMLLHEKEQILKGKMASQCYTSFDLQRNGYITNSCFQTTLTKQELLHSDSESD